MREAEPPCLECSRRSTQQQHLRKTTGNQDDDDNVRDELTLAFRYTKAESWQDLLRTLTDLAFLEAKAEAGHVVELAGDFAFALRDAPSPLPSNERASCTHPCGITVHRRHLELLEVALLRDLEFLRQHPRCLFQQLYNYVYWYDAPEAAAHYMPDEDGTQVIPGAQEQLEIHRLLEYWREVVDARGTNWLRAQRPPQVHLATALKMVLRGHKRFVYAVSYSPTGKRIVSGSYDGTVRVWDASTGALVHTLEGHRRGRHIHVVLHSPNEEYIVSASEDRTVRVWDAQRGVLLHIHEGHDGEVNSITFSPDSTRMVSSSGGETCIRVWDLRSGQLVRTLEAEDRIGPVEYSSDGLRILGAGRTTRVWNAENGSLLLSLRGHEDEVSSALFRPDGKQIITASYDTTARIWDAQSGELVHVLNGHNDDVYGASFSPDGQRVVTDSLDTTVRVWDARTGTQLHKLEGRDEGDGFSPATFSPDGTRIVSLGWYDLRIWDAESGALLHTLERHEDEVTVAQFSPDGAHIVSASLDDTVRIWNAHGGAELCSRVGDRCDIRSVGYSPDGERFVSAGYESVTEWDSRRGVQLDTLWRDQMFFHRASFSPDGQRICGADGFAVRVWDAQDRRLLATFRRGRENVFSLAWSPDGMCIATAHFDFVVRVWAIEPGIEPPRINPLRHLVRPWRRGAPRHSLRGHKAYVTFVAFSPDGSHLLSASWDGTVRVWDTERGKAVHVLKHVGAVRSARFSADGRRIVTAGHDHMVRIWDAEDGGEVQTLKGHEFDVGHAMFSPDGRHVVSASSDNTVRIWDAHNGELLETIPRSDGRTLDGDELLLAAGIQPATADPPVRASLRPSAVYILAVPVGGSDETPPLTALPRTYDYVHTNLRSGGRRFVCLADNVELYELQGPLPED